MYTGTGRLGGYLVLAAAGLCRAEPPATAQPDPEEMVTDRPDFTESASTVPAGGVQIESGVTFATDNDEGEVRDWTLGEVLVRVGLAESLELRIGVPNYSSTRVCDAADGCTTEDGFTDSALGLKVRLMDQEDLWPEAAVLGSVGLPTGASSKSADGLIPEVKLALGYDFPGPLSLGVNLNASGPRDADGDHYLEPSASASLAIDLGDRWGAYAEYFGFYPVDSPVADTHYLNAGVTFLVSRNVQLDARVGVGLVEESEDVFAGMGISVRF